MEKYLFREITANLARNDPKHKNANNQFLVNPEEKDYILGYKDASDPDVSRQGSVLTF